MTLIMVGALGWGAGLWLAAQAALPVWAWLLLTLTAGASLVALRRQPRWRLPLAAILCLGLGGARYQASLPLFDAGFITAYTDQGVAVINGVVSAEPDVRDTYVNLKVDTESILQPGQTAPKPVRGKVLVSAPRYSEERRQAAGDAEFHYGDRLTATGHLATPAESEEFSYKDYLARQGVYAHIQQAQVDFIAPHQGAWLWERLFDFKAHAQAVLAQIFPEPHAALLTGILLGNDSGMSAELKAAFSATGTAHIIAISGFNVGIIAGLFSLAATRLFGRRYGLWVAVAGIAAYTLLVGAGPSVVRAAIMGGLALTAQQIGRRGYGLNTLAIAAFLMTLINPQTLWDVGFQLSAAATLGLVLYAEPLQNAVGALAGRWLAREKAKRTAALASELVLLTVAAQITTLPLMAVYFRSVSIVSLAANLLILPAQPALMVLAGLALVLGLIYLPLGQLAAWLAWPFSRYTLTLVQALAHAPAAILYLDQAAPAVMVLFYLALFALTALLGRPADQRPAWWKLFAAQWLPTAALASLALGTAVAWSYYFSLPDGRLKIAVLDVGQGDAVLLQTPAGSNVLIDGGPSSGALLRELAKQLPLFTRRLDLLVIAAPGDASLGALPELLMRYSVKQVIFTQATDPETTARGPLKQWLADHNVPVLSAARLPTVELEPGLNLRVIFDGARGSGLRVEYGNFSLVNAAGLRRADENTLLQQGGLAPATALLVGDSGSERATGAEWVEALDPHLALICVSAKRGPAQPILDRLAGRAVLRTDVNGTLTIYTDGKQMWVETER
jgi:competence protein ComEC